MLQSVINNGTGASLRSRYGISAEMGGKTGTTNANSDSWFMGFTPELVTGVWVGGEERYIQFNSMAYGQGARAALPIYGLYMKKVYDDPKLPYSQSTRFDFPADFNPCDLSVQEDYGEEVHIESVPGIFE
jgi:penicillin-binding protein 1A